jgi:hypothetical protein
MNLREVNIKYVRLAVLIHNDSAEIVIEMWGFRYGLNLGFGTQEIMARTGVFVLVVCTLKRFLAAFSQNPAYF